MQKKALIIAIVLLITNYSAQSEQKKTTDTLRVFKTPSITVSTGKAEERRTPVPHAEIRQAEILRSHSVKDLPQMLSELPSILVFSEGGSGIGYSNLTMRGFNQRRIAVMVNGIPQNDPEDHNMYWINLPDIAAGLDNIQVQRGAGTAAHGFPSIGGSINLETSNFTNIRGAILESGVGFQELGSRNSIEQNVSKYSMQVSSGLIDNKYAVYGRLSRINSDGYRDYSWAKLNSYFLGFARFDDNVTTQINIYGGPFSDGLAYNGLPKSYIKDKNLRLRNYNFWMYDSTGKEVSWANNRRKREIENFTQPHYEMLNDIFINDRLTLKSSLFFYSGKGFFDFDGTGWTDKETFRLTEENGFIGAEDPQNPIIRAFVYNRHGGWLPRMQIKHNRGTLTLGAEFRMHRSEHWGKISYADNLPDAFDPDYKFYQYNGERDIIGLFAREEFDLTDKLLLLAEIQSVYHSYRINNEKLGRHFTEYYNTNGDIVGRGNDLFDIRYFFINPRIGANYNINEQSNLYTFIAYTSREPRMNNLYNASSNYSGKTPLFDGFIGENGVFHYDFNSPLIKPESMLNFELGWTFRNDNLFLNANAYLMEYFDELVKSGKLDVFGNPIDGNAPRTRHFGIELQAAAVLSNTSYGKFEISGNATFSRNEIIEFYFVTDYQKLISLKGNSIAGFPDVMGNLRFSYTQGNFYASILGKYVGEFRTDNFGDLLTTNQDLIEHLDWDYYTDNKLDPYFVFNSDVSYTFNNILSFNMIELRAQVFNLFNKFYAAGGEGKEFFPAAERNFYLGIRVGI